LDEARSEEGEWAAVHFAAIHSLRLLGLLYRHNSRIDCVTSSRYLGIAAGSTALHVAVAYQHFDK